MANPASAFMSNHTGTVGVVRDTSLSEQRAVNRVDHTQDNFVAHASGQNINRVHLGNIKPLSGIVLCKLSSKIVS